MSAYFVILYCCAGLTQFFFDVLTSVCLFSYWALINLISGGTILYIQQLVSVMLKIMELCKFT